MRAKTNVEITDGGRERIIVNEISLSDQQSGNDPQNCRN